MESFSQLAQSLRVPAFRGSKRRYDKKNHDRGSVGIDDKNAIQACFRTTYQVLFLY